MKKYPSLVAIREAAFTMKGWIKFLDNLSTSLTTMNLDYFSDHDLEKMMSIFDTMSDFLNFHLTKRKNRKDSDHE